MNPIYFATNRNPEPDLKPAHAPHENPRDFGKEFNKDGLGTLRFGHATRSDDGFKLVLAPENLVKDKKRKKKDGEGSELGSKQVFLDVREAMKVNSSDTIVYIHGFNVEFKEALKAATKMQRNFQIPTQR